MDPEILDILRSKLLMPLLHKEVLFFEHSRVLLMRAQRWEPFIRWPGSPLRYDTCLSLSA